ncbi:hypothetical protein MHBO_002781, partial [Bonamia ostreae]
ATIPPCASITLNQAAYSNSTDISLRVKIIPNTDLCLKIKKDSEESYSGDCIPIQDDGVDFGKLESATKYLFEIYSYVNISNGSLVLSTESCEDKFPTYTSKL